MFWSLSPQTFFFIGVNEIPIPNLGISEILIQFHLFKQILDESFGLSWEGDCGRFKEPSFPFLNTLLGFLLEIFICTMSFGLRALHLGLDFLEFRQHLLRIEGVLFRLLVLLTRLETRRSLILVAVATIVLVVESYVQTFPHLRVRWSYWVFICLCSELLRHSVERPWNTAIWSPVRSRRSWKSVWSMVS